VQGGLIVDKITIESAVPTEKSDDAGDDAVEQIRELLVGRWIDLDERGRASRSGSSRTNTPSGMRMWK